jgi:hypothetical protein
VVDRDVVMLFTAGSMIKEIRYHWEHRVAREDKKGSLITMTLAAWTSILIMLGGGDRSPSPLSPLRRTSSPSARPPRPPPPGRLCPRCPRSRRRSR